MGIPVTAATLVSIKDRAACLINTHCQVLWCESTQAGQVSPGGGVVELLNLLDELLLQTPLFLIPLRVGKLHHQR